MVRVRVRLWVKVRVWLWVRVMLTVGVKFRVISSLLFSSLPHFVSPFSHRGCGSAILPN